MQFPVVLVVTERFLLQLFERNVSHPRILPFRAGNVGVILSNIEGNDPAPQSPVLRLEDEHNPVALPAVIQRKPAFFVLMALRGRVQLTNDRKPADLSISQRLRCGPCDSSERNTQAVGCQLATTRLTGKPRTRPLHCTQSPEKYNVPFCDSNGKTGNRRE